MGKWLLIEPSIIDIVNMDDVLYNTIVSVKFSIDQLDSAIKTYIWSTISPTLMNG